jgi:3',5'-cyclic-nucleotide phosphodiesterase
MILTDEFARQASMESELGIPSALFAPPVREIVELGKSQLSFMNMFAIPLFQGVTDVLPAMQFTVDELHKNLGVWSARIEEEQKKEVDNSTQMDGMFSPRHMSLAIPSDPGNQQGTSSPSTPLSRLSNYVNSKLQGSSNKGMAMLEDITESDFQDVSSKALPDEETTAESNGNIESESLIPPVFSEMHRSSKSTPGQLQLSYATTSAPGLLDHPSQAADAHALGHKSNGVVGQSLVTDAVVREQQTPTPRPGSRQNGIQRTSDTTEGSNSAPSSHDWNSQATSATTGKVPLSPSTRGTSVMSDESAERTTAVSPLAHTIDSPSPTMTNTSASQSCPTLPAPSDHTTITNSTLDSVKENKNGSGVTIMETMRTLARKSSRSRFRMSFWKKKNGAVGIDAPPVPMTARGNEEEEMRGRTSGRSQ